MDTKERNLGIDLLKILITIGVIILHYNNRNYGGGGYYFLLV